MAGEGQGGEQAGAGRPDAGAPAGHAAGRVPGQAAGGRAPAGQVPADRPVRQPSRAPAAARLRTRWRAAFFALAGLAILAGVAWALLGSRFFIVRTVKVTGTGPLVHRSRVLAAARIPIGVPVLRVDTAAVAGRVERITQVQSAQVSIDWPSTVVISVRPRTPVFAVPGSRGYALLDAFGVDVRESRRLPPNVPVLTLPGVTSGALAPLRGNPTVRAAAVVLGELPSRIAGRVTAVTATGPSEVSVRLGNGVTIVWGSPANAAAKAIELRVLMRRPATLYDVSSPATAVTRG